MDREVVHAYQEIDWEIVFAIITTRLDDSPAFASSICRWMDALAGTDS